MDGNDSGFTRRDLFYGALGIAATANAVAAITATNPLAPIEHAPLEIQLRVNGRANCLRLDARTTLLDALREHLNLTGTKKGCDQGQCGACTVHVDGENPVCVFKISVKTPSATRITMHSVGLRIRPFSVISAILDSRLVMYDVVAGW